MGGQEGSFGSEGVEIATTFAGGDLVCRERIF